MELYAQAEPQPFSGILTAISDKIRQRETHREILVQRIQSLCRERCKVYAVFLHQ